MSTPRAAPERDRARLVFLPARARALRACSLASCLGLLLACAPDPLRAHPAAVAPEPAAEQLLANVRANGIELGEFRLARVGGDWWLRAVDVPRLPVPARQEARRSLAGETWYSGAALGAAGMRFDESTLVLDLQFRTEVLAATRIDLSSRPPPLQRAAPQDSLVLSYRLGVLRPGRGRTEAVAAADLNVRVQGLLLRQETSLATVARKGLVRGATQVIWDDPRRAMRVTAGDVVSAAGSYGTTITGAGVLVARLYDLAPDLVRQPAAHLQASAALPAEVEVSVDGSTLYRGNVGPGPIALDNLVLNGGTRTVRVVVTDASGRREVIERPFFFTDSVLARGLQEYSYFAGRRSDLDADREWHYEEKAWQAFHRYGVSDNLTVSAGGEGSAAFRTLGAGVTLRSTLGLFSLDVLDNRDRERNDKASGWSARYTWLSPLGSLVLGRRRFDAGFRSFQDASGLLFPRSETRVGVATAIGRVHLSGDLVRTVTDREQRDTGFVRVSTNLTPAVSVFAELQTTRIDGQQGWAMNLYLRADLDARHWKSAALQTGFNGRRLEVETGQQLPDGEGIGYRIGSVVEWDGAHPVPGAYGVVDWNLRPATVGLFARGSSDPARSALQADVAGAVIAVGGHWGLTRQVSDSFLLARLGVPQPGVEILMDNQPQGRTNAAGELLIPQLSSYGRHDLSVAEQDLAIEYTLPQKAVGIAPAYRSGHVVDFGIHRVRAVAGRAWQVEGGRRGPVVARAWEMAGPAGRLAIQTGTDGAFYLDDAPPGAYRGELKEADRTYACRMQVPEFREPVHEMKEGIVCE